MSDYLQARNLADTESLTSMATDYRKFFKPLTRRVTVCQLIDGLLASRKQDGASKSPMRFRKHYQVNPRS